MDLWTQAVKRRNKSKSSKHNIKR